MKKVTISLLVFISFVFVQQKGSFTDPGGKKYKTVKIGEQTWMAENLDCKTSGGSGCFDNLESSCESCGRLYDWNVAKKACPKGWHLPTKPPCHVALVDTTKVLFLATVPTSLVYGGVPQNTTQAKLLPQ